jgi:hypothetical protein
VLTYLGASAWTFCVDMLPAHSTTLGSKKVSELIAAVVMEVNHTKMIFGMLL